MKKLRYFILVVLGFTVFAVIPKTTAQADTIIEGTTSTREIIGVFEYNPPLSDVAINITINYQSYLKSSDTVLKFTLDGTAHNYPNEISAVCWGTWCATADSGEANDPIFSGNIIYQIPLVNLPMVNGIYDFTPTGVKDENGTMITNFRAMTQYDLGGLFMITTDYIVLTADQLEFYMSQARAEVYSLLSEDSSFYINAFENGYDEGEVIGYDNGHAVGYNLGYAEGVTDGSENQLGFVITIIALLIGFLVNVVLFILTLEFAGTSLLAIFVGMMTIFLPVLIISLFLKR